MRFCGTSRACPDFSSTEEDIKKFVSKLKIATKRVFVHASRNSIGVEEKLNQALSNVHLLRTVDILHYSRGFLKHVFILKE
jgi:Ran GTPase-activating protein (RanGAP) involved in mRNA processing and transport